MLTSKYHVTSSEKSSQRIQTNFTLDCDRKRHCLQKHCSTFKKSSECYSKNYQGKREYIMLLHNVWECFAM